VNTIGSNEDAARLVARAKRDKEEAKDLRDEGDFAGAVRLLIGTVKALEATPLAEGLETAIEPSRSMCELATEIADCLGMLGGNHRRLGQLVEAQACFERGRRLEESPALGIMSSYNIINAITLPLETDGAALVEQRPKLEAAVAAIGRQVRGDRRNDRWAWADLAQCQLLLGEQKAALQSYARVRALGDGDTLKSVVTVLERLRKGVPQLADSIAHAVESLRPDPSG
jgi:tetratricopeptide (TPR) repeat protein